ncbi:MAG TPA: hypothetical protein DCW42_08440 [Bacteroidetes bacterium]|nr:hypothetical protein [Bacteroidota bacterium]
MNRIIKQSAIFGIGNIISRSIAILLVPLYTRHMTVEEFGIFSAGLTLYTVLSIIMKGGGPAAMLKLYMEDSGKRQKIIFLTYAYSLSVTLLVGAISMIFCANLIKWLIGIDSTRIFTIIILSAISESLIEVPLNIFRAKEKSKIFAFFSVLASALTLIFTYFLIVVMNMRIEGAFLGMFLAKGVVFILSTIMLLPEFSLIWDKTIIKEIFILGAPIVISGLSMWFVNMSDRIIITNIRGGYEAGLYSLGNRIGTLLNILILTPFSLVWGVESLKIYYNSNEKDAIFSSYFLKISGFCFLVGAFLSLFAGEMISVFATAEYMKSIIVIPIISVSNILYVLYYFHTFYFMIIRKTYVLTGIVSIGAVLNILLNLSLLKYFDYRIVSLTNLVSTFLIYILTYREVSKKIKFDHNLKKVLIGLIIIAICAVAGLLKNSLFVIVMKILLMAVSSTLVILIFKLDGVVKQGLKRILRL